MRLFLELFTLAAFIVCGVHAARRHGIAGLGFFAALALLGAVRETAVAAYDVLYGFAPRTLSLGPTPLIAAVIWAFSIYTAVTWTEVMTDRRPLATGEWRAVDLLSVGVFMLCLAGFYEPFLGRVGMAQWEAGTRATMGVPWIALVGYPTLSVAFCALWWWLGPPGRNSGRTPRRPRWMRVGGVTTGVLLLAVVHAFGLQALKDFLAW